VDRELVVENETGFLVPLGSRAGRAPRARVTDRLFSDIELSRRLGVGAWQRNNELFAARMMIAHYSQLYSDLPRRL
jgi:hypothetical protein